VQISSRRTWKVSDKGSTAIAHAHRLAELPDVPTMAEAGMADFEVSSWNGLVAPAGTPKAFVDKVNAEVNKILGLPEVQQRFATMGARAAGGSPKQFSEHLRVQIQKRREMISVMRISLD
jgi:tripartite-type tricarboxylate transporter receptor subunit TctC